MSRLSFAEIDQTVLNTLKPASRGYWITVGLLFIGILIGAGSWGYQIVVGLGVAIINYHAS